jgi:hypothetical protein
MNLKLVVFLATLGLSFQGLCQTWQGNTLRFFHPTMADNGDETWITRSDINPDETRLRIRMGDEETSLLEVGYNSYLNGQWIHTFTLDGYGNANFKGTVDLAGNLVLGNRFRVLDNGNIGIGHSAPGSRVSIRTNPTTQGLIISNCDAQGSQSHFGLTTADQPRLGLASESYLNFYNDGKWNLNSSNSSGSTVPFSINMDGSSRLFVQPDGHIGIGTVNPGPYRLAVEGKVGAREVNVTTSGWSDYVFHKDYALRPLSEVQQFISENHHLPDVPSEKEVLANGQNLGEMNVILLKKIEELTLYMIQAKDELDALKSANNELRKMIQAIGETKK